MTQIPHGPNNLTCPDRGKLMSKVCHTCPLWMKLPIKDPHTNAEIDEWKCAHVWKVLLEFHQCRETFSLSREVNELRNETKKAHDENVVIGAMAVQRASEAVKTAISDVVEQRATRLLSDPSIPRLPSN